MRCSVLLTSSLSPFVLPWNKNIIDLLEMVSELKAAKRELKSHVDSLREEAHSLMQRATQCEAAEIRLRDIAEAEGFGGDEVVQMVKNNEKVLELLRTNKRERVTEEVVRIVLRNASPIISEAIAKSIASEIAMKLKEMDVLFDEEKFIQALASYPTLRGAISAVKKLLPDQDYDYEKGDVYDMFYLSNEEQKSRGSVDAMRASIAGAQMSLAQRLAKGRRHSSRRGDEKSSTKPDDEDPERPKTTVRDALKQFWIMAMPYFREDKQGRYLFAILIMITLANNALNVYFSYVLRDFLTALTEKHVAQFYRVFARYVASMIIGVPIQVSYRYMYTKIGITWRKWLTEVSILYCIRDKTFNILLFSFAKHSFFTSRGSSHYISATGSSTDLKRKETTQMKKQEITWSEIKKLTTQINVYKKM